MPSNPSELNPAISGDANLLVASLATGLAEPGDLESLLARFLVPIVAMAGAQAGAVRVLTDDGHSMRLVAQQGLPAQVLAAEQLVDSNCGMCGVAASLDGIGWVDDVASCAARHKQVYFGQQCQGVLAISLPFGQQVLGIYNLFFATPTQINASTQTLLRLIGQLLGQALHNARIEQTRLRMTVMKERQEMVNEVHDALAQTLAYTRMRLPLLSDAILAHDDQKSLKYFSDVKTAVGEVHDNLREVMTYFRTRMDPMGLMHALRGIADGFFNRTGIELELRNLTPKLELTDQQEVQVFHIVQEALANIAKYSMARHAVVTVDKSPQGLEFLIEDDGLGIDEPSVSTIVTKARELVPSTHLGLEIMRSRARRLGGSLEVGGNDGTGTRVRLLLPPGATLAKGAP
ncbi:MAG: histidine kinase [Betaproteobacteria bacterium HGW-Betaproteobacteria-18]|nr:MAG: histidine kinase [Betaproteobacteria bacterium HGW-Betaproteobacteria-18]